MQNQSLLKPVENQWNRRKRLWSAGQAQRKRERQWEEGTGPDVAPGAHLVLLFHMHPLCRWVIPPWNIHGQQQRRWRRRQQKYGLWGSRRVYRDTALPPTHSHTALLHHRPALRSSPTGDLQEPLDLLLPAVCSSHSSAFTCLFLAVFPFPHAL